jgi:hypothetical protein
VRDRPFRRDMHALPLLLLRVLAIFLATSACAPEPPALSGAARTEAGIQAEPAPPSAHATPEASRSGFRVAPAPLFAKLPVLWGSAVFRPLRPAARSAPCPDLCSAWSGTRALAFLRHVPRMSSGDPPRSVGRLPLG